MTIYSNTPFGNTAANVNPFQAGLNQLEGRVQQLQSQTAAMGASAYNNPTLVNEFNSLVNLVGQYQQSVTNAGAAGTPYQSTLNGIDQQLNQIKTTLTTPSAAPSVPTPIPGGVSAGVSAGMPSGVYNSSYSNGLGALSNEITQLQAQVAAEGTMAANNPSLLAGYRSISNRLNAYINSANASGQAATNPNLVAALNGMTQRMYQVRAALESDYRATHYNQLPNNGQPNGNQPWNEHPYGGPVMNPGPYGNQPWHHHRDQGYDGYDQQQIDKKMMPVVEVIGAIGAIGMIANMLSKHGGNQ